MTQNNDCATSGVQPVDERVARALADIRFKVVVMSGKGGVGKSTVAAYLALGLADKGYKVGLLDVDLHGPSIPRMLGLSSHAVVQEDEQRILPVVYNSNLRVISIESLMPNRESSVIWRGPLKIGVVKQFIGDVMWDHLDFLVIDSPPGTGDVPLTVAQTVEGAYALVVTTPQEIALADVRKSLDFCRQVELPVIGVVENMSGLVCPHCGKEVELFGQGGGEAMAKNLGLDILARLPIDPRIIQAADQGRPLKLMLDDTGSGPAYQQMVAGVLKRTAERR
ncbi:ATPase-like, ParA/MinD [Desulfarculus baarsii DSM 2075]|uniref:Iron-sulfur cluster carrier protein n=1 Tax=Desulfarculus baarsii (strain ATCC 33931 / DSM 2075 / LMG 7858 / VKM B-1802 / 2st14) TaxID=644282 RepID=E1QIZ9_DESB2|nr:Mrp/NBP35 family ATP-binding protein [Desulfarculus baarsii]ADK85542.1 ATPase-like, ParA/MinD [Desulfarculus baarsii DSM 2075]